MFVFVINNFNDRLIDLIYFHLQFIGCQVVSRAQLSMAIVDKTAAQTDQRGTLRNFKGVRDLHLLVSNLLNLQCWSGLSNTFLFP